MESFINFKSAEWLLKGDGLDSVEVQNMDYVLEFDEFVRSIKQNMDTKFSMFLGAGVSVISRQSLGPQTLNRQMTISTLVFEALA